MGITVRGARPEDAARVAEINLAAWRDTYGHLLSAGFFETAPSVVSMPERWRSTLARRPAGVFVAELDGEVVGYAASGQPRPDELDPPRPLELYMIYQFPRLHGSGSGQALLDAALGVEPAFLWVAADNPRARAFYRRNGLEPDGAERAEPAWEGIRAIRLVR